MYSLIAITALNLFGTYVVFSTSQYTSLVCVLADKLLYLVYIIEANDMYLVTIVTKDYL